jgi:hypothetical protein
MNFLIGHVPLDFKLKSLSKGQGVTYCLRVVELKVENTELHERVKLHAQLFQLSVGSCLTLRMSDVANAENVNSRWQHLSFKFGTI